MERKQAIKIVENTRTYKEINKSTEVGEALIKLLSTTRQAEEVVGKCKEEIEYYRKSLENENNKNRIKLKELALHFYEGMLALLTEEE